jgi:replicative DNA helicase
MEIEELLPPSVSTEMEESLLGSILISPGVLKQTLQESGVTPDSFYVTKNRRLFEVILRLHEEGTPPSYELVSSHINGEVPKSYLNELINYVPSPGNAPFYAKRVVEFRQWRERRGALIRLSEAVQSRDMDSFLRARSLLDEEIVTRAGHNTKDDLVRDFVEYVEASESEALPIPFLKLAHNLGGGLRRGQMTILGGWTSHGKSVILDQMLEYIGERGFNCHLYMNEMTHQERMARYVTRKTGIPFDRIAANKLSDEERARVYDAAKAIPFTITACAGWNIQELTYDIRQREFDLIAVDIIHLFDYDSEIELARISRLLNRVAKQANCHVIGTVHLNEGRATDTTRPRPVTRDIRGSGMLKNDADNVLFIYREQDIVTGDPGFHGSIYASKVRNGSLGSNLLRFDDKRIRFLDLTEEPPTALDYS